MLSWSGALPPPGRKYMLKPWEEKHDTLSWYSASDSYNNLWKEYNNKLKQEL